MHDGPERQQYSCLYGPGVDVSDLGASAFGELAKDKPAQLLVPADTLHDFAYVPDIARAAIMLLDASDEDFGQAWNMPCAPTRSPRALLAMGAAVLGDRLRVWAVPLALLRLLGLFYRFAKEVADVGFTWDRAYVVHGGKFSRRFDFVPTSFEIGVPATVRAFAARAGQPPRRSMMRSLMRSHPSHSKATHSR
ncbi:hypothetical protein [uncultured Sphingomonas sp.]|uniref:hypothetical protein n=1 Tax=uncultured Sphingomonas sp. TaxID=158754 RepID=UPI0035C960DD